APWSSTSPRRRPPAALWPWSAPATRSSSTSVPAPSTWTSRPATWPAAPRRRPPPPPTPPPPAGPRRPPREPAPAPSAAPASGWQRLYIDHVLQADRGADLDFLVGRRG